MEISTTKVKVYKGCRREYMFKYIEKLVPVETSEALEDGKTYHNCLEQLYNEGWYEEPTNPKIKAMVRAYERYILPQIEVIQAEMPFTYEISNKHTLVGRFDGIARDGNPIEHKTTSYDIDDAYLYRLYWDEQVLNYMLVSGTRKIHYTAIKKPTIRQKKEETDEEFFKRCLEWYEEDTNKKIGYFIVERTNQEVEEQRKQLVAIANEMEKCKNFYTNPNHCQQYGRDCPYKSICLHYSSGLEYVEFIKEDMQDDISKHQ